MRCSVHDEPSLRLLEDALADLALGGVALSAEDTLVENTRQAEALRDAVGALANVEQGLRSGRLPELVSIDLRTALEKIGGVTGIDVGETVLNRIFSDFCIGK
jgi:tRNA modification GTPase